MTNCIVVYLVPHYHIKRRLSTAHPFNRKPQSGGADMQIDKKKARSYREFLYILPFIILVGLFSYFPLYGWIYAFHDYMPPKPISS